MPSQQIDLFMGNLGEDEKLRALCLHHDVQPVDAAVFQRLSETVAWEILDFNLKPIYRCELVSKFSNYSIEDYQSHSHWDLFKRPHAILLLLAEKTIALKLGKNILDLDNIPAYVLEEAKTAAKAQFRMKHLFACPLASKTSQENLMFLSAFRIEAFNT